MTQEISAEMWKELEEKMQETWVNIIFEYQGYKVSVSRVKTSESRTCLQVYIDNHIKGLWISFKDGDNGISEKAPKILADVWCKKTRGVYTPKAIKECENIWGKRQAKKRFPDLYDKRIFYVPDFSKASVLCRQFKKLKGLQLVKVI